MLDFSENIQWCRESEERWKCHQCVAYGLMVVSGCAALGFGWYDWKYFGWKLGLACFLINAFACWNAYCFMAFCRQARRKRHKWTEAWLRAEKDPDNAHFYLDQLP